jgi:hypothetical protein
MSGILEEVKVSYMIYLTYLLVPVGYNNFHTIILGYNIPMKQDNDPESMADAFIYTIVKKGSKA